jgi:CDP-diacylglycerol--glycerol-3-phosphate 3-phosphatidyltransferase
VLTLYSLKPWFSKILKPILKLSLRANISPDLYSLLNICFGALAGFGVYWLNTWVVLVAVVLRLACANLDGALARAKSMQTGKPLSRLGFAKNEIGDRLADFSMMAGLVFLSETCLVGKQALTVLLAVFITAIPTLISLIGVSKGIQRINGGPMGKTERAFTVVLIVALAQLTGMVGLVLYYGSLVLILGSVLTAWVRYLKIVRA